MALDTTEGIPIPLKPLPPDVRRAPGEAAFRDAGVVRLPVRHFQQMDEQGNPVDSWCYAACAQMVFDFYQKNVRQCEIAGFTKHAACCPPALPVCTNDGCEHADIKRIYDNWGISSVPHLSPTGRISWEEMKSEILAGRPVEVVRASVDVPGNFHAIIVNGFNDASGFVMYQDPASDEAGKVIAFGELIDSTDFIWDSTWTGLKK